MNEIRFTISKIPENNCNALIQHIQNSVHDYDAQLQIDISVSEPFLWLTTRKGHFKLYYSKCRFIETDGRSLIFHCEGSILRKNGKISSILEKLPDHLFFRCNNSYIVNLNYISKIIPDGDRYSILLRTGEKLPLSRSRYQKCLSALKILKSTE